MVHVNPDLSCGIISEKNTGRFFVRLWPEPVCIQEVAPGIWNDLEDVRDDFNLTGLVVLRDQLVGKYRDIYPDLIALIMRDDGEAATPKLPKQLWYLQRLHHSITMREKMLACIPPETLRLVRSFPEGHFALLQLLYACPNAVEMIYSNPALASMLASCRAWCDRNSFCTPDNPSDLIRMKRVEILRALGFRHADQSLVNTLGKITPWACRREQIFGLIDALKDRNTARIVRHLPQINLGAITLLADKTLLERIGKQILHEVANDVQEDTHANTALKVRAWTEAENRYFQCEPPLRFGTLTALDELVFRNMGLVKMDAFEKIVCTLPHPPIPDQPDIIALRESSEVFHEGYLQNNCLFSRLPELYAGKTFAYKVLAPERATLTIQKHKGQWQIDELESAYNNPVSDETREFIQAWLDRIRL